jgi:hypothetical protein
MFGATVQNSVARVTWCPGFLQPCLMLWFLLKFEVAKINACEKDTFLCKQYSVFIEYFFLGYVCSVSITFTF